MRKGWTAVAALLWAAPVPAQVLSLPDALARAEEFAYGNRIAAGQASLARSQGRAALRGILPTVRLEAGFVRTTDPIGAFGTALRQRRISQADLDPGRLNYPADTDNYLGSLVVEQPLLNADAHLGRVAAGRAAAAAEAQAAWTRSGTRLDVLRAYYGAVLAAEQERTLAAAHRAAEQHVAAAEAMERQGLVTKSDALLARVKAGEIEAELLSARGEAALAGRSLAVLLGTPEDSALELPAALPGTAAVRRLLSADLPLEGVAARADVRAAEQGLGAARLDVRRAQSLHLPRLNAFARYDWNSAATPFAGDENWTVGVMASWTVFGGASEWAERQAAGGRAATARAQAEAAVAQASLEVARTENARRTALLRLDVMERGAQQGAEAHRIVSRRYQGGLASVVELLEAAAVETQSALALSHARYTGIVVEGERRRAAGQDPAGFAPIVESEIAGIDQ
jgi:outer membrane protein TolC